MLEDIRYSNVEWNQAGGFTISTKTLSVESGTKYQDLHALHIDYH